MSRQHVVVLAGGLSHERDVSLRSGRRVAEAMTSVGAEASVRDVDSTLMTWLVAGAARLRHPLLHGEAGEDGALREMLELVDVPYVGATPRRRSDRVRQADRQAGGQRRRHPHPGIGRAACRHLPRGRCRGRDGRR